MQRFTVPQFIDVENKIIGPVTTRQFLVILSAAIIIGISYKIFDFSLFLVFGIFVFIISSIFAFARINGRPFHFFVLNVIQTFKRPNLRIWNHRLGKGGVIEEEKAEDTREYIPKPKHFTSSRLAELSLIVDTKGAYKGEDSDQINIHSA
jgi:hypothetical protein